MSDTHGPIWIVEEPAQPYHDGRFDGVEPWMADPIKIGVDHPHYKPPLDPQQPTPPTEQQLRVRVKELERERNGLWQGNLDLMDQLLEYAPIVNAARLAVRDMETVFRKWGYIQAHPLPELQALLDMLTPPAPKWTAPEEPE